MLNIFHNTSMSQDVTRCCGHIAAMQPYAPFKDPMVAVASALSLPRCPKSVLSMTGVLSPGLILTPLGRGLPSAPVPADWKVHCDQYPLLPHGSIRIQTVSPYISRFDSLYMTHKNNSFRPLRDCQHLRREDESQPLAGVLVVAREEGGKSGWKW